MVTIDGKKISPNKKIITDIPIQIVYIPLENRMGHIYEETVHVGEYVCIGSIVGKSNMTEVPLLSTVSGTVVGFSDKYISNGKLVKCVVIENDFKEKYKNKVGKKNNITKYSKDEFIDLLKNSGILGMSGSGFPTYIKYNTNNKINYLIIDGAECEVYCSCDSARMYNNVEEILECIDAIMEIMDIKKAYIAINEKNEMIINKFLRHINTYPNIKIYPLMDAYPNGYERYLISEILGISYDKLPIEVGVINENVSTIYAIYEMLKYHKIISERIVTISGDGIKKPANYKLKIGTNFSEVLLKTDILNEIDNPLLVCGGAMMGKSISSDELIITTDVGCVLIMNDKKEKTLSCIKCGKCTEVCPMNLIPSLIMDNPKMASELKIDKCVKCGLCSYVCPSKIDVRECIIKIRNDMK